ncbi:hypothetical protein BJ912DRAFT_1043086 [Pholiota molesta]|nr:hypothetical protein BJ912DRAFT_1043086 [Pholiota molesta]
MMQLQFLSVLSVLICSTIGTARILPTGPILDYPQLQLLHALCESGGSNSFVAVLYSDNTSKFYNYGECLPYALDGATISGAIFCKSATCYNKGNARCTGGTEPPVPIPVFAGMVFRNAADFAQLLGDGAICTANDLPDV